MSDACSVRWPRARLLALFLLTLILGAADCDSSSSDGRRGSTARLTTTQAVLVSEEISIEDPGPGPAPTVPEPGAALVFGLGALMSVRILRRWPIR